MGPLQSGLPSPALIPENWPIAIMDIKDSFFNIYLHPQDARRFAFTVPSLNAEEPAKRFHWAVLPQGMENSPTICQSVVAQILSPVRFLYPQVIIYHYMDDILLAAKTYAALQEVYNKGISTLMASGLEVAPEKTQTIAPWRYLGLLLSSRTFVPQRIQITNEIKTLNQLQTLLGNINWVRSYLGLSTNFLAPLFRLLKGDLDLSSPRVLTPEARDVLDKINQRVSSCQARRMRPGFPLALVVFRGQRQPYAVVGQVDITNKDFVLWEWIFLSFQFQKTITTLPEMLAKVCHKGRMRFWDLVGKDPDFLYLPLTKPQSHYFDVHIFDFQMVMADFSGKVLYHLPSIPFLQFLSVSQPRLKFMHARMPIPNARTVFTDGSGKTGKAVVAWAEGRKWLTDVHHVSGSSQLVELSAVLKAFSLFPQALNIVSDSAYVVGVVSCIENGYLKDISNQALFQMFSKLLSAVQCREYPFYIQHVRSHMDLPGPIFEGNRVADRATNSDLMVKVAPIPNKFEQAQISHKFFHQSAESLRKHFDLSVTQARAIVSTCSDCQKVTPVSQEGVNPWGLQPLDLWQADVTHVPQFGRLGFVHVSVDTCSGLLVATAHAGEKAKDGKRHFSSAFSIMGIPKQIKTDNGPAYVSSSMREFFSLWGIKHITGIPHSPQGQAIIERAHLTLKNMLTKQNNSAAGLSPQERLNKALYVLNFLNRIHEDHSPIERHFRVEKLKKGDAQVWFRDIATGEWVGPVPLLTWGRGHACVSTGSGPRWIPSRCVRFHQKDTLAGRVTAEEEETWGLTLLFG
ncbi:endogenous retrovirus group K member 18 Pol protein-like protein [Willisornis vidua]|uniref:Endogenous retrovirus group K member 18 Pol protein-like protein n=1 Tax=Willisornis vidua TaxID=1566151 RepID=A0ABQ9DQT2_9PASS|nr:endogenous retrovirus group K member 18 Pol protein-like protein [Willisornis vidua]